jgi:hypothetical protein
MPSENYRQVWRAVRERKQITCVFEGRYREACPIILGYSANGRERALVFQVGGQTSSRSKLPGWRCFNLADVHDLRVRAGLWAEGDSHKQTQSHVRFVDVDINLPDTLTRPEPLAFGSPQLRPPRI